MCFLGDFGSEISGWSASVSSDASLSAKAIAFLRDVPVFFVWPLTATKATIARPKRQGSMMIRSQSSQGMPFIDCELCSVMDESAVGVVLWGTGQTWLS